MPKGAVFPNTSNFRRTLRYDVVGRMRMLQDSACYQKRPDWLLWCERVPPMELSNLQLQDKRIRNPYPQLIRHLLKVYPDLRFQDCFVDGNDWQQGNDVYRSDHPVMQFVARQQRLLNENPTMSKREAFKLVEEEFRARREKQEQHQKLLKALTVGQQKVDPLFATGGAVRVSKSAEFEALHLRHIRKQIRTKLRRREEDIANEPKGSETMTELKTDRTRLRGRDLEHARLRLLASTIGLPDRAVNMRLADMQQMGNDDVVNEDDYELEDDEEYDEYDDIPDWERDEINAAKRTAANSTSTLLKRNREAAEKLAQAAGEGTADLPSDSYIIGGGIAEDSLSAEQDLRNTLQETESDTLGDIDSAFDDVIAGRSVERSSSTSSASSASSTSTASLRKNSGVQRVQKHDSFELPPEDAEDVMSLLDDAEEKNLSGLDLSSLRGEKETHTLHLPGMLEAIGGAGKNVTGGKATGTANQTPGLPLNLRDARPQSQNFVRGTRGGRVDTGRMDFNRRPLSARTLERNTASFSRKR